MRIERHAWIEARPRAVRNSNERRSYRLVPGGQQTCELPNERRQNDDSERAA